MRHAMGDVALAGSPIPPIAEYAFLSDCETTALVAPSGNVEWLCVPRMDGPSVFGALLDRDAGWFRLGPAGVTVPAGNFDYFAVSAPEPATFCVVGVGGALALLRRPRRRAAR